MQAIFRRRDVKVTLLAGGDSCVVKNEISRFDKRVRRCVLNRKGVGGQVIHWVSGVQKGGCAAEERQIRVSTGSVRTTSKVVVVRRHKGDPPTIIV